MNSIFSSLLTFLCLSALWSVIITGGWGQMANVKVLERGDDWQCPSTEERDRARNELHQIASSAIVSTICNGTPGWRRVAFINMTDTSYNCPTGLNLTSYSKRTCGRLLITEGCSSTSFSAGGLPYSHVCGRIRGYQVGATGGFGYALNDINSSYVDGVSLTHGATGNRQHIWTFAVGASEVTTRYPSFGCPCDTAPPSVVPTFVGSDYFCESGLHSEWDDSYYGALFPDDVLWDGQNCTSTSTCCQFNNPPWFTKNLPSATTDDIELRICTLAHLSLSDIVLELVELYIQ